MSPERTKPPGRGPRQRWLRLAGACAAVAFLAEAGAGDDRLPPWVSTAVLGVGTAAAFLAVTLAQRQSRLRAADEERYRVVLEGTVLPVLHLLAGVVADPSQENRGRLTQSVVEAARHRVPAGGEAWCGLYRYGRGRFRLVTQSGPDLRAPEVIDHDIRAAPLLLDAVVRNRACYIDDPARGWGDGRRFAAVLAYPVVVGAEVHSMLLVAARGEQADADTGLLALLAKVLGIAATR